MCAPTWFGVRFSSSISYTMFMTILSLLWDKIKYFLYANLCFNKIRKISILNFALVLVILIYSFENVWHSFYFIRKYNFSPHILITLSIFSQNSIYFL